VSEPTKDHNPKAPKRSSRRKPAMEPLGWDEIVSQPGMGGYLSFLNGPIPLPHLQPPAPELSPDPAIVSDPVVESVPDLPSDPGIVPDTVVVPAPAIVLNPAAEPNPVLEPSPVAESDPVVVTSPVSITSPAFTSGPEPFPTPGVISPPALPTISGFATTTGRRPRIRKCVAAHDGHSLGEEVLYQALWSAAVAESAEARIIVVGWRGMSQLCRMTPKNCKINTQRLIRKLALEVLSPYNTPESIGTTYRIFPSEAILRRRRAAGLEWVVRSRGVEFVDPATGIPLSAHLCGYVSEEALAL
jgi:hypothetical protein